MTCSYLQLGDEKRIAAVREANPQPGHFVNLTGWFGDVWAEIETVYDSGDRDNPAMSIHYHRDHRDTDYVFFKAINKVRSYLPANARIVHFKEGKFGDRDGTLTQIPDRVERGPRDYTPAPVEPTKKQSKPRNRYKTPESVNITLTWQLRVNTDAFDGLNFDTSQTIAYRVLSLPYVKEVDWVYGSILLEIDPSQSEVILAELRQHLTAKPAKREKVTEHYNPNTDTSFGASLYSYRYHPGDYPLTSQFGEING